MALECPGRSDETFTPLFLYPPPPSGPLINPLVPPPGPEGNMAKLEMQAVFTTQFAAMFWGPHCKRRRGEGRDERGSKRRLMGREVTSPFMQWVRVIGKGKTEEEEEELERHRN